MNCNITGVALTNGLLQCVCVGGGGATVELSLIQININLQHNKLLQQLNLRNCITLSSRPYLYI